MTKISERALKSFKKVLRDSFNCYQQSLAAMNWDRMSYDWLSFYYLKNEVFQESLHSYLIVVAVSIVGLRMIPNKILYEE